MRLRRVSLAASLAATLALAACNSSDILDVARKANQPLPRDVVSKMQAVGTTKSHPIMMRIFKDEAVLEVWKKKDRGRYELIKTYEICKYSGNKGPKFKEGDRQAPEGFYFVHRGLMNPNSAYYLSFNLGFPNAYDRSHGRTGSHLMVHGDCSSAGCYAMTDEYMAEIYAFARDALNGGQERFQVQAFPFRMTAENMAQYRDHEHFDYWQMLKKGYDHFELTRMPPKVDVCERRYVFNQNAVEGEFSPSAQCPVMEMPYNLALAYTQFQNEYAVEYESIVARLEGRAPNEVELLPLPVPPAPEPVEEPATAVEPGTLLDNAAPATGELQPVAQVPAPAAVIATATAQGAAVLSQPEPLALPIPAERTN